MPYIIIIKYRQNIIVRYDVILRAIEFNASPSIFGLIEAKASCMRAKLTKSLLQSYGLYIFPEILEWKWNNCKLFVSDKIYIH